MIDQAPTGTPNKPEYRRALTPISRDIPGIASHPEISPERALALDTIAREASGARGASRYLSWTAANVAANIQSMKETRDGMPAAAAATMKGHYSVGDSIVGDLSVILYKYNDNGVLPTKIQEAVSTLVAGSGMSAKNAQALLTKMSEADNEVAHSLHFFGNDKAPLAEGQKIWNDNASRLGNAIQAGFESDVKKSLGIQSTPQKAAPAFAPTH